VSAGDVLAGGGGGVGVGVGVVDRSSWHGSGGKAREGGGKAPKGVGRSRLGGCSERGGRPSASGPAIADEELGESC